MKDRKINELNTEQMLNSISELFTFISLIYAIKEPEDEFYSYFVTYLKKHYDFLTFEQLENAYELNSMGYLDMFLNKIGASADNKIRNFSIPALTKIINAFIQYKKIGKNEDSSGEIWNPKMKRFEPNGKVFTQKDKSIINNEWCDYMALVFEKYRDEFERTIISAPLFTAKLFTKYGILEHKDIDISERRINFKVGSGNRQSDNEDLIYKSFDKIIQNEQHIEDYLNKQRGKYSIEMPW